MVAAEWAGLCRSQSFSSQILSPPTAGCQSGMVQAGSDGGSPIVARLVLPPCFPAVLKPFQVNRAKATGAFHTDRGRERYRPQECGG